LGRRTDEPPEVALTRENQTVIATSFYEIRDGRIYREVDYWPEPYPAPEWRKQWVEPMNGREAPAESTLGYSCDLR